MLLGSAPTCRSLCRAMLRRDPSKLPFVYRAAFPVTGDDSASPFLALDTLARILQQ